MSESASTASGVAGRYATAVFDLVKEGNAASVKTLEADVGALDAALKDSAELRDLIVNPVYSREDQGRAIAAVAAKMGLSTTLANTLKLLAENQSIYVPLGAIHRLANPGKIPVEIIEVQTGTYLEEDDIERIADEFGRA